MNRSLRHLFLFAVLLGTSLPAAAFTPKTKFIFGTEGASSGSNEVKLPVGLPFSICDPSTGSGTSEEGTGTSSPAKVVYTFDLPDGVGPESVHETHSAFQQARSMNAVCVLIRMQSMSGALDAAQNISNELSDYDRPVMVYVNDKAIPASQLISMASDKDFMRKNGQQKTGKPVLKKADDSPHFQNNVKMHRRIPRDEANCTSVLPASLSVYDPQSDTQNNDLDAVLEQAGLNNYKVVRYSPGFFGQLIDWCMRPYISLCLVVLIALGLRLQLSSAFPGPATFILMAGLPLFGVPLFMGGLAGAEEITLAFLLCIALIVAWRKKSSPKFFRGFIVLCLLLALTFCQSAKFGGALNAQSLLLTFAFTSASFAAGWLFPNLFRILRRAGLSLPATA